MDIKGTSTPNNSPGHGQRHLPWESSGDMGSGRRNGTRRSSRSGQSSCSRSAGRVKQEWDDRCGRGNKERHPSEQEHRQDRSSDRDRHKDHSDRKNPSDRPGALQDTENLQELQAEREFYNKRRREHRQGTKSSGYQNPELQQSKSKPREKAAQNKQKPSFELFKVLLEDTNTFRGVVIKYSEPSEAHIPKKHWRLYPFKNNEFLPVMSIHRHSAYLLGRHCRIADIPINHYSCSKQHAVLQYHLVEHTRADGTAGHRVRPYIIDLGSGNGTFLKNHRIVPQHYYQLKEKDMLKFGFSSKGVCPVPSIL